MSATASDTAPLINDSLIPLLMLPVVFIDLFFFVYFINRFFINKTRLNRVKRTAVATGIASVMFLLPWGVNKWEAVMDGDTIILIAFPVLILLNVFFSIWYRRN